MTNFIIIFIIIVIIPLLISLIFINNKKRKNVWLVNHKFYNTECPFRERKMNYFICKKNEKIIKCSYKNCKWKI